MEQAQVIGKTAFSLLKLVAVEHLVHHAGSKGHRRLGIQRYIPDGDALTFVFDGGIAQETVIPWDHPSFQADLFFIVKGKGEPVIAGIQRGKIQSIQLFGHGAAERQKFHNGAPFGGELPPL